MNKEIEKIALDIQTGDFSAVEHLIPLLTGGSFEIRRESQRLFAQVCNHKQVRYLGEAIFSAEDEAELLQVIIALGDTLSLEAIPILLAISEEFSDYGLNGYISTALKNIFPVSGLEEHSVANESFLEHFVNSVKKMPLDIYYYSGNPVFIGDLTRELICAAQISLIEKEAIILVRQPQLLTTASGMECPIEYGTTVSEEILELVYKYVKKIASMGWQKGCKYYHHHKVI